MSIHPTAIISTEARLAPDIHIGPYAIIEGPVTAGPGTVLHSHSKLLGPLTLGIGNVIHSFAVIGDTPQDRKFNNDFSETIIGDANIFREGVTIHRGTGNGTKTIIGHRNYFMANSHVGHNCVIGNDAMLVNGAVLAGHCQMGDRVILGAYSAMHQFTRLGRLSLTSGRAVFNVDLPPFFLSMSMNHVNQLNAVGLRRSGMSQDSINALRKMFQLAFRDNRHMPLNKALASLPVELLAVSEVQEVVEFCKSSKRGVALFQPWSGRGDNKG